MPDRISQLVYPCARSRVVKAYQLGSIRVAAAGTA
jgi:hypothetical protein